MKGQVPQLLLAKMSSLGMHSSSQVFASFSVSLREYPCMLVLPVDIAIIYVTNTFFKEGCILFLSNIAVTGKEKHGYSKSYTTYTEINCSTNKNSFIIIHNKITIITFGTYLLCIISFDQFDMVKH